MRLSSSALYPPLAGSVRCYLVGWGTAKLASVLQYSLRPGAGAVRAPATIGAALASLCAAYHAARWALTRRLRGPRLVTSSAAVAGCVVAWLWPEQTIAHSELHTAITVLALQTASRGNGDATSARSGSGSGVDERSRYVRPHCAAEWCSCIGLPVTIGSASTWALLVSSDADCALVESFLPWRGQAASVCTPPLDLHAAIVLFRQGAVRHLYVALAARLVARGPHLRRRTAVAALVRDAIGSSGLHLLVSLLAHSTSRVRRLGGWAPGLALLLLPPSRRETLALRLGHHATFATLRLIALAASHRAAEASGLGGAIASVIALLARSCDAVAFAGALAVLMRDYACTPRPERGQTRRGWHGLLDHLLGYDKPPQPLPLPSPAPAPPPLLPPFLPPNPQPELVNQPGAPGTRQ